MRRVVAAVAFLVTASVARADPWWREPESQCPARPDDQTGAALQAIDDACALEGPTPEPTPNPVQGVLDCLLDAAPRWSAGTDLSISVRDLGSGASASIAGDRQHVSASSAKAIWLAAALDAGIPPAELEADAQAIASVSSNSAAADVIRRVGPNRINEFMERVGMGRSAFNNWSAGQHATNSPYPVADNLFTSDDVVTLLAAIDRGEVLPGDLGSTWKRWLSGTPRSGYGGWLGSRLPEAARASMIHKAGWLPPGCCGTPATAYNDLNEVGIVDDGAGHRHATAILASHGEDWGAETRLMEYASCAVYRAASADASLSCGRAGDPAPDVCTP